MVDCIQPREMTQAIMNRVVQILLTQRRKRRGGFNGVLGSTAAMATWLTSSTRNQQTSAQAAMAAAARTDFAPVEVVDAVVMRLVPIKLGVRLARSSP